jgi:hypothetical protein
MKTPTTNQTNVSGRCVSQKGIIGMIRSPGMLRSFIGAILTVPLLMIFMAGCGIWDRKSITGPSDNTAPTITSTVPANTATGVAINTAVSATFSEAMDPATITTATFSLKQGTTSISGAVTYVGLVATFKPAAVLTVNTTYTATVTTGAEDKAGNALAGNYMWTFTTGAAMDDTPPTVVSTDPADNATDVALNKIITAKFSEAMDPLTITTATFTLKQGTTSISGAVTYVGLVATFKPAARLTANTTYTATITTGAKDLAGNALAGNYVWTFTTGAALDVTLPTVISTDPANNATDVALNKIITATFSEAMDPLTVTTATFTLKQGTTPVSGAVTYVGTGGIFTPTSPLTANTTYTATITTGAEDLAGNALASSYVWTFTTGAAPPPPGPSAVNLGCIAGFSILAGSTVTNTGNTIINGDLGLSPGSAVVGFPPGIVNGTIHINDTEANNSKSCLTSAYNDAAGRAPGAAVSGNIGGQTLAPGVYTSTSSLAISSGDLTLDAQGNSGGVFIFQIPSSLTVTSGRQVILAGGAQAKNIFWQVGSSATIGTTAAMKGTILADQSVTLETGATLLGRALTRIGAVTMDSNSITVQ